MFVGCMFEGISRLVAKVRMKLPYRRQHRFGGFRAPKKRKNIGAIFGGGPRELGIAFCFAFDDFGCPPGSKKESMLELASVFFEVRYFNDFRALRMRCRVGAGGRGWPLNPSYRQELGCYPITACSPSARGAPNPKDYALCRRPPVNTQPVTGRIRQAVINW